jgi:uncharacterized protein (TIGR00303 family)
MINGVDQPTTVYGANDAIRVYACPQSAIAWLDAHRWRRPHFVCVLGFTETALIPGISAAGATPEDRRYTAVADAEFLWNGPTTAPCYPLPPLQAGASPVLITRAVVTGQAWEMTLLNAGLPVEPSVPCWNLGGSIARCVSTGAALSSAQVQHLFERGLHWGEQLATGQSSQGYLVVGECVAAGTTTALAILKGLGFAAEGKVNSSHPQCNHQQKLDLVEQGLRNFKTQNLTHRGQPPPGTEALAIAAAVGDPMQPVVAGLALAASAHCGVLLAGGTQMLAVYALARAIAEQKQWPWRSHRFVVGTTRWVAEDPSGDTPGLAKLVDAPLIATGLSFANSRHASLRAYEQGFVKEGVGAGGSAIAASLYQDWRQSDLLSEIDQLADRYLSVSN